VLVYRMQVTQVAESWPEQSWRARNWLYVNQALLRVEEFGLRELIRGLNPSRIGEAKQSSLA